MTLLFLRDILVILQVYRGGRGANLDSILICLYALYERGQEGKRTTKDYVPIP